MPVVHDFKSGHFYHTAKLVPDAPLFHRAETFETDPPFRRAKSLVIRLWPSATALVVGRFKPTGQTEDEALMAAVGWDCRDDEVDLLDDTGHLLPQFEEEGHAA